MMRSNALNRNYVMAMLKSVYAFLWGLRESYAWRSIMNINNAGVKCGHEIFRLNFS